MIPTTSRPRQTTAVCPSEHAWSITLQTTQYHDANGKHLHNEAVASVPNCPTCGAEWSYVDHSREPS